MISSPRHEPSADRANAIIDRFFIFLYDRTGARYLQRMFILGAFAILVVAVALAGAAALYLDSSIEQFRNMLLLSELGELAVIPAWLTVANRGLSPARRWLAGHRSEEDGKAAWDNIVNGIPPLIAATNLICMIGAIPAEYYASAHVADGWTQVALLVLGVGVAIAGLGTLLYIPYEACAQQVMREIAELYPSAPGTSQRVSMSMKLLLLPPIMSFVTVLEGGALIQISDDPAAQLGGALLAAATLSLTVSLAATLLMRRSLLAPLEALRNAAARVGAGDLDVRVAPMAGDELASLTHGFNEMVEALRRTSGELRESRARIVTAADAERRRVEQELRGGAQQGLEDVRLELTRLGEDLGDSASGDLVRELEDDVALALNELRDLARGIYPVVLESGGLPGALADAVSRTAPNGTLESHGTGRHAPELEAAVYFCCLEALQNINKHAGPDATSRVVLRETATRLTFEVSDDGPGFDTETVNGNSGLRNMGDRLAALGGTLEIVSGPGSGTTISGSVAIHSASRAHTLTV